MYLITSRWLGAMTQWHGPTLWTADELTSGQEVPAGISDTPAFDVWHRRWQEHYPHGRPRDAEYVKTELLLRKNPLGKRGLDEQRSVDL
jgi:hypothetical protein